MYVPGSGSERGSLRRSLRVPAPARAEGSSWSNRGQKAQARNSPPVLRLRTRKWQVLEGRSWKPDPGTWMHRLSASRANCGNPHFHKLKRASSPAKPCSSPQRLFPVSTNLTSALIPTSFFLKPEEKACSLHQPCLGSRAASQVLSCRRPHRVPARPLSAGAPALGGREPGPAPHPPALSRPQERRHIYPFGEIKTVNTGKPRWCLFLSQGRSWSSVADQFLEQTCSRSQQGKPW